MGWTLSREISISSLITATIAAVAIISGFVAAQGRIDAHETRITRVETAMERMAEAQQQITTTQAVLTEVLRRMEAKND